MNQIVPVHHAHRRQRIDGVNELIRDAVGLFQAAVRQQHRKVAAKVARQQRAGVAQDEGREHIDQIVEILIHQRRSQRLVEHIEIGQAHHHHHAVRADILLVFQQRRQLIVKKESVVEAGAAVLRGEGANQRVDAQALLARLLQIVQQHVDGAAGARRPFIDIAFAQQRPLARQDRLGAFFQPLHAAPLAVEPAVHHKKQQAHHQHHKKHRCQGVDAGKGLKPGFGGIERHDAHRYARLMNQRHVELDKAVSFILQHRTFMPAELKQDFVVVAQLDPLGIDYRHRVLQPAAQLVGRLFEQRLVHFGRQRLHAAFDALMS